MMTEEEISDIRYQNREIIPKNCVNGVTRCLESNVSLATADIIAVLVV